MPAILQTAQHQPKQPTTRGKSNFLLLPELVQGRIQQQHLEAAIRQLQRSSAPGGKDVLAYVCGPPQMTDDISQTLLKLGLDQGDVHTERWW